MNRDTLGRRILLAVGATVVLVSGVVGAIIGENAAQAGATVRLFGRFTLPAGGVALGTFAAVLALVILGGLFSLVELASRLEDGNGDAQTGPK
ncbi:MAG: hypothetical protein ABEJ22_02435 [Haloferacaceae archaeon]